LDDVDAMKHQAANRAFGFYVVLTHLLSLRDREIQTQQVLK